MNDFINEISVDLKRIASRTCGEHGFDDLQSEAYFYVRQFHELHHRDPDPGNSEDKSWVLRRMYKRFVTWADHTLRYAVRIDALKNDDGDEWVLEFPAEESSDPLVQLLFREQSDYLQDLLKHSYSEAKAYLITFNKFDFDKTRLSHFFLITTKTLDHRCARAIRMVKQQASLFDPTEEIDDSFNPLPGQAKAKINALGVSEQLAFVFQP